MSIENLSAAQLRRAANIKERIATLERELGKILGQTGSQPSSSQPRKKKRHLSAAARERIAAAQRARWARQKGLKK